MQSSETTNVRGVPDGTEATLDLDGAWFTLWINASGAHRFDAQFIFIPFQFPYLLYVSLLSIG
jgi:hypothetical protein